MKELIRSSVRAAALLALAIPSTAALADGGGRGSACAGLPSHSELQTALADAVDDETSGLNNQMWGTIVNRDGVVCAVAFSGTNRGAQWPGSRAIAAQKANTANAYSLDASSDDGVSGQPAGLALSTANLYSAVQPGGSLYGLQHSNPVDPDVVYKGPSRTYGRHNDPMVGKKPGGVNVFGGGLALYAEGGVLVGAVGVSGDTSCADHNIGWRVRNHLGLDFLGGVFGVNSAGGFGVGDDERPDNIIFDIAPNGSGVTGGNGLSEGGFGHPTCINTVRPNTLPAVQPPPVP